MNLAPLLLSAHLNYIACSGIWASSVACTPHAFMTSCVTLCLNSLGYIPLSCCPEFWEIWGSGILKNASFTLFRFLHDISGFFVTLFGAFFVTPTPGGTPSLMGWFFKVSPRSAILASSGSCVTLPVLA